MKNFIVKSSLFLFAILILFSCKKDAVEEKLEGTPGNPRFNLKFTNPENVDLDLHVLTPDGSEIYFDNPNADGGNLDVDCLCGECPNGPNENIYWVEGSAPSGTYKYWVEYYGDCGGTGNAASEFTLRLVKGSTVLETYSGTLSAEGQSSTVYTFVY